MSLFLIRLILAVVVLTMVLVLTQDMQVFPGALSGVLEKKGVERESLPPGIRGLFVHTSDQRKIEVWHLPAEVELERKRVAIIFHGNADTLFSVLGFQLWFRSLGIDSYAFSYRGYGRSTGWPSEKGLYLDAEAVYQLYRQEYDEETTDLIILGSSIGSGAAAQLASRCHPRVLLLLSPYTSLKEVAKDIPLFRWLRSFLWYDFPVKRYLGALTDTCVLAVHGQRDRTILVRHTEELRQAFAGKTGFKALILPAAGHNDLFYQGQEQIAEELLKCLAEGAAADGAVITAP